MRAYRVTPMMMILVLLSSLLLAGCAGKDDSAAPQSASQADMDDGTPVARSSAPVYEVPGTSRVSSSQEMWEAPTGKVSYVIAPFTVNGPQNTLYLQRGIPQMITSRVYVQNKVVPTKELPANAKPVTNATEAEKLRAQHNADYVIWGTANIVGDRASIEAVVRNKAGKQMPIVREANADKVMDAIGGVSESLNRQVFRRSTITQATKPGSRAASANSGSTMNADLMDAESRNKESYLNPQFRYSGVSQEDDSRLRSQAISFASIGMEIVDATGNGRNEIFLLDDRTVYAYNMDSRNQLQELGKYEFPINYQCLNIRSLRRPNGKAWIIVNAVDKESKPKSAILTFDGSSFSVVLKDQEWYLNVAKLPPTYQPTLIGELAQPPRLFKPGSLSEVMRQGDKIVPVKRLDMPKDANVFNFTYLPGGRAALGSDKLIVLGGNEKLRTYAPGGKRIAQSPEQFSGSAVGLEINPSMPGLGRDTITQASVFYIPMRMEAIDLEQDGNWELLVNKPISTASQIFDRYRSFPQSELHSLFWDGTGLNLQWKTRRIKGSMVDYTIADANNDGVPDLVCCVNTHPGALGVKARKTMVILYPLDMTQMNPNAPVDKTDIYD